MLPRYLKSVLTVAIALNLGHARSLQAQYAYPPYPAAAYGPAAPAYPAPGYGVLYAPPMGGIMPAQAYGPPVPMDPAQTAVPMEYCPPPAAPPVRASHPRTFPPPAAPAPVVRIAVDSLTWWVKSPNLPPLLTTGSAADPLPGGLGQPNTRVLYGNESPDYGGLAGLRLEGEWYPRGGPVAVQVSAFQLERASKSFSAASGSNGLPLLARPIFDTQTPGEIGFFTSLPGSLVGRFTGTTTLRLAGLDANLATGGGGTNAFEAQWLLGYRTLDLSESLTLGDVVIPTATDFLNFGTPTGFVNLPNYIVDYDRIRTANHFHGGQFGTKLRWTLPRWQFDATAKVAMGVTQQHVVPEGGTALVTPTGVAQVANGGVLVNNGSVRQFREAFSVVPEVGCNLGLRMTPWLTMRVGYSFLYWSEVARPGDQVNRTVNTALLPSSSNVGTPPLNQPIQPIRSSDFLAHGLNLGLELRY